MRRDAPRAGRWRRGRPLLLQPLRDRGIGVLGVGGGEWRERGSAGCSSVRRARSAWAVAVQRLRFEPELVPATHVSHAVIADSASSVSCRAAGSWLPAAVLAPAPGVQRPGTRTIVPVERAAANRSIAASPGCLSSWLRPSRYWREACSRLSQQLNIYGIMILAMILAIASCSTFFSSKHQVNHTLTRGKGVVLSLTPLSSGSRWLGGEDTGGHTLFRHRRTPVLGFASLGGAGNVIA
jgi:hypothetical protein